MNNNIAISAIWICVGNKIWEIHTIQQLQEVQHHLDKLSLEIKQTIKRLDRIFLKKHKIQPSDENKDKVYRQIRNDIIAETKEKVDKEEEEMIGEDEEELINELGETEAELENYEMCLTDVKMEPKKHGRYYYERGFK